jgi:hypothetical protein
MAHSDKVMCVRPIKDAHSLRKAWQELRHL